MIAALCALALAAGPGSAVPRIPAPPPAVAPPEPPAAPAPEVPVAVRAPLGVVVRVTAGAVQWAGPMHHLMDTGLAGHLAAGWAPPSLGWLEVLATFDGGWAMTKAPPPPQPGVLTLSALGAELRVRATFWRLAASAGAGAGFAWLGPNLLLSVPYNRPEDSNAAALFASGSLALEWLLEHPRFSILLEGRAFARERTAGTPLLVGLGLRHAF